MPSGKDRKEDTWKESDLKKALKPEDKRKSRDDDQKSKERSSRRSEDRRGHREHDDEKKRRRHEDSANGEVDSRRTNKERDVERDREREQDRERRKREEKKDRERTKERDHDRDKRKEKDSEGLKERRTKDRSEERERSKDRRKEKERADKEHDRDRIRDKDRAIQKDKESSSGRSEGARERDRSKERRKDLDRNKEKRDDRDKSKERRKEKSGEKRDSEVRKDRDSGRSHGKDGSRERTKEREDRDRKNRDKDRDKQRERERNGEKDKSREHHKEKEKEGLARENEKADRQKSDRYDKDMDRRSKHTERSRERRQGEKGDDKREQRDDIDRRKERSERHGEKEKGDKIKRREKELMASLKQEEDFRREHLKFRSDTLEEADVIDEDVELNRKVSLQRMPSVGTAEEVHDEENDGYHYDDDDFEDYDEDFEDDDDNEEGGDADGDDETSIDVQAHSGLQELLEALNAENEGARTSSSEGRELINDVHRKTNKENVKPMSATHGRINFVAAKQKQISDKVASRTRRRGQELMHLIDLDVAAFDIFDLPPLNEYELYIKNFGRSDTKQAYVQCNEDNVEKEVQTEEIETRTKWTQNPASDAAGFGDEKDNLEEDLYSLTEKANVDSIRLASFLQRATQTCLILLEESVSEQTNTQFKEKRDMTCSDGYMQLATKHSYLEGRPVKFVHVSPVQTHFLLIAYAPVVDKINKTTKIPKSIQDKGLICVWNTNEPSDPQKVLICESTPRCCCLSPSKATLAFAGLEDGSLVAWDLREPSSMHYMSKVSGGDSDVILRSPTFSTAGILKKDESHMSPVVSLLPLVMPGDSARASAGSNIVSDDMLGLSFQLASLEENAFIFLWVVVEFDKTNSAGSESDLGLSPGGKIKLIKSSSISLQSPSRNLPNKSSLQTLILKFLPHDPNHVYVGTDGGYVIHCDRHGGRSPPKAHRPGIDTMERIAAIDLSPWQLPCLLSGSENGNLWLFTLKNEFPLLSWPSSTSGSEILSIQWSHSRPSVFYVLDSQSNLHVWDLLKSDKGPVAVEKVKHGRVTCFELSSDYSASGIGTPGRNAELVLVYESGAVEIHRISSVFSKASGDDLDRFASYLESVL